MNMFLRYLKIQQIIPAYWDIPYLPTFLIMKGKGMGKVVSKYMRAVTAQAPAKPMTIIKVCDNRTNSLFQSSG